MNFEKPFFSGYSSRIAWLGLLSFLTVLTAKADPLRVEVTTAYNAIVDSNVGTPASYAPSAFYISARVWNDGTEPMENVVVRVGDFTENTPGVYPSRAHPELTGPLDGEFALTHEGGSLGAADATRNLGTIAPGSYKPVYWLVSYPALDENGNDVTGGTKPDDDLFLYYDVWATGTASSTLHEANKTRRIFMRSCISAMANKIFPNTANKVPQEYKDLLERFEPEWADFAADGSPGTSIVTEGIWYDLGNVNKGFDNDGDLVPDQNAWLQPVGDPSLFDPSAFRLVKTYALIIVKLKDGGELVLDEEDLLYFTKLPDNTGVVGLVRYDFKTLQGGANGQLTPYQMAASGQDNEKFNGDFGASIGESLQSPETQVTFDKSVDELVQDPGGELTYTLAFDNPGEISVGAPDEGLPLVVQDVIPAHTSYLAGSAVANNASPAGGVFQVYYSTDGGFNWTTVEPSAEDVTDLQWWLNQPLASGDSGEVTFSVTVDDPFTGTFSQVENTGGLSFGSATPFLTATAETQITGNNLISGTVFADDGAGDGIFGNGEQDGTEAGLGDITVRLYLDTDGSETLSSNDLLWATSSTDGNGNYSFGDLPDGNWLIVVDTEDPDLPEGFAPTNGSLFPVALDPGSVEPDPVEVTDVDIGFAPILSLSKTGPATAREGEEVTYEITVNNNFPGDGSGGGLLIEFDAWTGTATSPTGNKGWPNPENVIGENDGAVALGRYENAAEEITLTDFGLEVEPYNIDVVTFNMVLRRTDSFGADEQLIVNFIQQPANTVFHTITIPATTLNSFSTSTMDTYSVDVSGIKDWVWEDFGDGANRISVELETGRQANNPGQLELDALGFTVTTDTVISASNSFSSILSPVPVLDTYDANALTFLSADPAPNTITVDGGTGELFWANIGTIFAGGSRTVSVTFLVNEPPGNESGTTTLNHAQTVGASFLNGTSVNQDEDEAVTEILPAGTLGGQIYRDGDLSGIVGVTVQLTPPSGVDLGAGVDETVTATTDFDGNYLFEGLPASGDYTVTVLEDTLPGGSGTVVFNEYGADNSNVGTVTINHDATDGSDTVLNADFAYDPASLDTLISGQIWNDLNQNGAPAPDQGEPGLEGVTVRLFDSSDNEVAVTTTAADGTYSFVEDFSGDFEVRVDTSSGPLGIGWIETYDSDGLVTSHLVAGTVSAGGAATADFSYAQGGARRIAGVLFHDWDGDGTQDPNEEGVPDVTVRLYADVDNDGVFDPLVDGLVKTVTTDLQGNYEFANLPSGSYFVIVDAADPNLPDPYIFTADPDPTLDGFNRVVLGSVSALDRDFGIQTQGDALIDGVVWRDRNADGVQSGPQETGISGITVWLQVDINGDGTYQTVETAVTDANGLYEFSGLPDGSYRVVVDDQDDDLPEDAFGNSWYATTDTSVSLSVSGGTASASPSFGFAGLAAVGNTIFFDANQNGTQDTNEEGIEGVTVLLYQDNVLVAAEVTDVNGNYFFTGLLPGTYTVVVDENSSALDGAFLTADPDADGVPCSDPLATDCDGETTINLAPSQIFSGADFGYFLPGGVISGVLWIDFNDDGVVDEEEIRIPFVEVNLYDSSDDLVASVETDENGFYNFAGLDDGTYRVVVDPAEIPGGLDQTFDPDGVLDNETTVVISGGNQVEANFGYRYAGDNSLSGTVGLETSEFPTGLLNGINPSGVDENAGEVAFENVTVFIYAWTDDNSDGIVDPGEAVLLGTTVTDADGDYQFADLPDSQFYIVAMDAPIANLILVSDESTVDHPLNTVVTATNSQGHTTGAYMTVEADETIENMDFAFVSAVEYDFGDLPETYSTLLPGGARHIVPVIPNLFLGEGVSTEPDGQPSVDADKDDFDDGVEVLGIWQNGADGATLEFDVTGSGWLLGFIDWEDNGTFLDAGNLVVSQAVSSGLVSVNLDVPEGALDTEGTTLLYSRFRLMPSEPFIPELGFTGEASNGEVEDYRWAFNSVSGNVWVDAVGNNPQGGVIIELVKDEVVLATTVTQVNGTYSFYGLPEGDYEIRLVEPDGATAKEDADGSDNGDDLIELEVTDSSFTDQYFVLDTEVTQSNLSGTVFLDSDRNGLFSGGDTEIENVVVRLYRDLDGDGLPDANEFVGEVLTDANGNYVFEDLPNGTFLIQMVPSAGVVAIRDVDGDANGDDLIEVDLAGSSVSGQDFLTEYTAFISGTVWVDSLGGAPQENVTIELLDDQGGVLFTVQTDINGVYSFPALPPETYQVRQTVPTGYMAIDDVDGGDLTVIGDVEPIELGLDEERTQQDFVNQLDGATITGRVWYDVNLDGQLDSGEPFANGVTVRLLDGDENVLVTAFTNPDGEYSFANLEPGNYQVEFVLPAGHDFTADTGDSSADPATGRTGVFSLTFGEAEDDVDAGLLSADLAVQKSVAPAATNIGESVTYTVTLDNFGPVNATGIVVTEFFPLGLDVGMVTPSTGSFNGSEWMLDLDAGQSATLTVEAEVTGGDAGSGLLNVVEITASDIPDPVLANNTASANLLISGLSLEKTSDAVGFVTPGQTITYTVVLENTGSATQSGILLEDLLPEGVTFEEVSSVTLNDPGTLTEVTEDFESSQTFFVPSGVTSLQVEAWGGGGGGASSDEGNRGGGGGGGGGYARVDAFTVTPGDFHTVTVGTGGQLPGPGNPGAPGGTSWFSNSDLLFAEGGDGGGTFEDIDASGSGASGGGTLADFTFTGGNGGAGRAGGNDSPGGGGGSSASDNSDGGDGGDGSNQGPGAGGVVPSGFGGDGGDGGSNDGPGVNPAMAPGGGGGGCGGSGASVGARGLVRITYTLENVEGSTGGPAALLSGYTLAPGGSVEVIYTVAVNDPAEAAALTNTASVTSELVETPVIASVTDSVAVGAILGSASVDTTGDNSGDTPLEDVTVRLLDADDGDAVVSTTTTNPNGEYAFTLLPPGNYIIEMLTPAGYLAIDDADGGDFNLIGDQDAISVDAGDEIDEQFFVLEIVPPVTEDDFSSGHAIGTTVSVNVLANDTPASGLSLVLSSVQLADADEGSEGLTKTVPGEGVWSVNTSNGVISFTPEPGYLGNPTPVEYTVEDSNGVQSNESTVTVIYTVAPVANDDESLANTPGETVILDVPDNDTADTGRTLDLTSVELDGADSGSDGKTLTVDGEGLWTVNATTGVITFEPESGFTLDPTPVQYTIRDDQGNVSNLATVTVDYVPVAVDDESTGNTIGQSVTVDVTANDTDGDTVDPTTVVIVDADEGSDGLIKTVENEGTWTVDPVTGAITFDPETGFTGNPTVISYTVEDDEGNVSDPASVTVTYTVAPVAVDDESLANTPGETVILDVPDNDTADTGRTLDLSSVELDGADSGSDGKILTVDGEGLWTVNATTGVITFEPEIGFTLDPTPVQYTIRDDQGNVSNLATVTVDYVPVAVDDESTGNPIGEPVIVDVTANDTGGDTVDPTTVVIVDADEGSDGLTRTVENEGTWTVDPVTGAITFDPETGFTGNPTVVSYTVEDDEGNISDPASVTVTYTVAPVANDDESLANTPGETVTLDVPDNDTADTGRTLDLSSVELDGADSGSDGKTLTVDGEGLWTVNATTGVITFEPESGFTLDPTPLQYTIRDDQGNVSNLATVTVDYVPVAVDDESTGNPIGEPVIVDVTANDTDGDTVDPTTVVIVDADEGSDGLTRTVENEGTWTVDPVTGAITFDPETGFTGNPTVIAYTVEDDEGNVSDPASVTVTYTVAPVANDDESLANAPGETVILDVSDNDTADTGRTLDLTSVELDGADSGSDGKILTVDGEGLWTVNATTGVITFEPESGFTLDPTPVQYTIRDDQGNVSNLATMTVDYVPVAVDDESTGNPIGEPVTLDVTANDTDGDTVDPTTVVIVDADEGSDGLVRTVENEGTWTVDPVTGAITFDPEIGFTGNPTVIAYTVEDDEGNISDPASVTVTYDQTGSIAGLIEIDTTGDGLGDTPQENVTIALFDSGGGPVLDGNNDPITTVTDASGAYSFSDLEPGDYQVQQTVFTGFIAIDDVDGGDLTINGDVNPISVNPGVNVTGQDFVNSQFGVVDAIEFCLTLDGGILGGSFERETDFPENVTWYVEYAIELADPTTWQGTVLLDSGNTTVNDNGDGTETVTMADIPSLTGLADGFGFVRIRMELDANEDGSADEIQSSAVSGWRETSSGLSCKTYHDPFLSCPLLRAAIDSVDGTTLTLDQAAENLPSEGSFYLEVVNGDWEGQRWDVVASNGNELTVAETAEISFFESPYNTRTGSPPETLSGADVVLLRHQTLRGILPVDGLEAGNVASEADHAILLEEHGFETYWLYENGGSPVWVRSGDATLEDQGDKIIAPGEAILFQPFQTETTLLAFGQVRENSFIRNFREGYQMVGSGFPLSQSPDDRDMTTAEGFTGSRDFSQADRLYRWRPDLGSEGQGWETTFLLYTGPFEQWTRIGDTSFASQNGEALFVPNRGVYFFMEAPLGEHREPLPWNP